MIRRNVPEYVFGPGSVAELPTLLGKRRPAGWVLWFVDQYFGSPHVTRWPDYRYDDRMMIVCTSEEPTVKQVDGIVQTFRWECKELGRPSAIVGIGGGSTMDTAKAVSVLLTNPGSAADYQGWDLVKNPAIYKIGVPTISGTGSETSSTAVLINHERNVKLGINSPYSVFDALVLDPDLTKTVPKKQRFYTAMDTFFHCTEYLRGAKRDDLTDELAWTAWEVGSQSIDAEWSKEQASGLMVASYLGGSAAGCTGIVHPFSAGLGTVLGIRHGLANCIAMSVLGEFWLEVYDNMQWLLDDVEIELPSGLCAALDEDTMDRLYQATVFHKKPLRNALGDSWRDMLTKEKVIEIFRRM